MCTTHKISRRKNIKKHIYTLLKSIEELMKLDLRKLFSLGRHAFCDLAMFYYDPFSFI